VGAVDDIRLLFAADLTMSYSQAPGLEPYPGAVFVNGYNPNGQNSMRWRYLQTLIDGNWVTVDIVGP